MKAIITWLLTYIQFQRKVIVYLLVLLTCKNISLKDDVPVSKRYQTMQVDKLPIFQRLHKFDYKTLLVEYQKEHGKELKPIKRRKNSKAKVPNTIKCPRCGAPHIYLYDNNGGKGQFSCKICNFNFNYKYYYSISKNYL